MGVSEDVGDLILAREFESKFAVLFMHSIKPPWANQPPLPAPGGTQLRQGIAVLKHCMLHWDNTQLLGDHVQQVLLDASPDPSRCVGAVGIPHYCCTGRRRVHVGIQDLMVACGNTVPLSPLLQCVVDGVQTKHWHCEQCQAKHQSLAPGSDSSIGPGSDSQIGARVLTLFPLMSARGTQGRQRRLSMHTKVQLTIELVVGLEPDGPWEEQADASAPLDPQCWEGTSAKRIVYTDAESQMVWRLAKRVPPSMY